MTRYAPEPLGVHEAPALSEQLEREHARVSDAIAHRLDLEPTLLRDVDRPREGMVRWFDEASYDPGQGTGLYIYESGQWQRLAQVPAALAVFSFAAYGALDLLAPVAGPDITAAWQTVTVFDIALPSTPRGVDIDLVGSTISFVNDGVYSISISAIFEHDELNAGREVFFRLWNITLGAEVGHAAIVGTGRNVAVTQISITTLMEITEAEKGNLFRLEVGQASTLYFDVTWNVAVVSAHAVSEWREPLP